MFFDSSELIEIKISYKKFCAFNSKIVSARQSANTNGKGGIESMQFPPSLAQ